MAEEFILTFHKDLTVSSEARGFKGKSCTDAAKFLDEIFGKPSERKFKSEYYQKETVNATAKR